MRMLPPPTRRRMLIGFLEGGRRRARSANFSCLPPYLRDIPIYMCVLSVVCRQILFECARHSLWESNVCAIVIGTHHVHYSRMKILNNHSALLYTINIEHTEKESLGKAPEYNLQLWLCKTAREEAREKKTKKKKESNRARDNKKKREEGSASNDGFRSVGVFPLFRWSSLSLMSLANERVYTLLTRWWWDCCVIDCGFLQFWHYCGNENEREAHVGVRAEQQQQIAESIYIRV